MHGMLRLMWVTLAQIGAQIGAQVGTDSSIGVFRVQQAHRGQEQDFQVEQQ